ncbi:hypothetical protein VC83_03408 [Pseudogymnoascus destructans]|uniref:Uncharacterized protein n=2 Tax=Pseudogymnoascus destructans TaxID=655981 RepID=L8FRL1_PSED2|nr:uncharacterized protein VC83_03408 [Pseudogymnoascus destructans]ELR03532.1 hypothetical protein GMDG_01283 [Pseudogymnoascus destructans 20631-21]OAF60642.1 hypothetical protein VC83_03408 [Pseudogymnoascus destructans]
MSPSTSQSLPTGKDPPDSTTHPAASLVTSPRLPYANLQPSQQAQEPQQESIMAPRPAFTPFFTLVDDATSGSTHHPVNVRYIFSDDDQDLTDEYLAAISSAPSPHSSSHIAHSSESSSFTSFSRQQQRIPSGGEPREPEHITLLLDLDASGTAVTAFHSLSPSWQLLSASITKAPTWESGPAADDGEDELAARFMLRLEGTKGRDEGMRERVRGVWKDPGEGVRAEDFQVLVEEFEKKMRVLRTVVDTGRDTLGLEEEEQEDGGGDEGEHEQQHEDEGEGEDEKDGPRE